MTRASAGGLAALIADFRTFAGRSLGLALAVMILGALAEGFGLLMIVPVAAFAIGRDAGVPAPFAWLFAGTGEQRFLLALAMFVAAMGTRSLLLFARDTLVARQLAGYEADLRLRAATALARRGWPFASRIGQAGMQSLLLNDVPRAAQAVAYLQQAAVAISMLAVQLALTFLLSPRLTVVALLFLGIAALVSRRSIRQGSRGGLAIVGTSQKSADSGFRFHAGLKPALAQGTVAPFLAEYRSSLAHYADQQAGFARDFAVAQQLSAFGAAVVAAVLLFVGIKLLQLPFPVLVASLVLFARMSGPAHLLQNAAIRAAANVPAFDAIVRRLGPLEPPSLAAVWHEPLAWRELRIENAGHEHQPGIGLQPLSLTVARGEWLGVRGASGSGKTTLLDLVAGLVAPPSGAILVDGQPLDPPLLASWRATIAYVGPDNPVFDDSIRGNLLVEGAEADDEHLWRTLDAVGLAARVRAFAGGLDETVGDRGSHLSGGERQRLVLARALLRRPTLIILDEATAALDGAAEAALVERMKAIEPRPAALVVAHRESTLAHCDRVIDIQHQP